jgi:hypothetical protein
LGRREGERCLSRRGKKKAHLDKVFLQFPARELLVAGPSDPRKHPLLVLVPVVAAGEAKVSPSLRRQGKEGANAP